MPYTLIQAGTSLQFLDTDGGLSTLSLPTTVTLSSSLAPHWVVYGGFAVLVNTPSVPLTIDATGTVRPLTPAAPKTAPVVSAGSSGSLSGTYGGIRYTNVIKDVNGVLIAESDMSPASNTVTITSKYLKVTGLETSLDPISARRLYRPTTSGTVLYPWLDVDGNTITQVQDDLPDAGLSLIAAPTLGNPPHLILLKEWRNRLWGVGDTDLDTLRYAESDAMWSWPSDNNIPVPGAGRDQFGIRALMPRREALGVGRRDLIWQITGQTPDDFTAVKLSEILGVESQESVIVYRDTVWWLWKDGVYQWDSEGFTNISDGKVKSWFSTDDYFNRDMFQYSFAVFDPVRLKYRLYLAAAGSTSNDRWVEYDIQTKTWWGPHKTGAFSPVSAFLLADAEDKVRAVAGSTSYYIWQDTSTSTDNIQTPIDFAVITRFFDADLPDLEKAWLEPTIMGKAQSAGTLKVYPKVGYLDASEQSVINYDMTTGRQRLPRFGEGKLLQLRFQHATQAEPVEIYGVELPFSVRGRR